MADAEAAMSERGVVAIFSKPPRAGEVKTRLAAMIGDGAAAELARAFFVDTRDAVERLSWADSIVATTEPDVLFGEAWLQGEGDLGARQERILRRALEQAPFAVAIGADSPGMPARILEGARAALQTHDAAISPARDGGYVLLALRRCPAGLFDGITWSSNETCTRLCERLRARELRVAELEGWFDVDTVEDLLSLSKLISRGEIEAPNTARVLARLGR